MALDQFVGVWDERTPESVSQACGWCARAVEMKRISPSVEIYRSEYRGRYTIDVAAAYVCPRDECHRPTIVLVEFHQDVGAVYGQHVVATIPRGSAAPMEGLPKEIDDVRREAWSDLYAGSYRSAVVMARAAVQQAVHTLGGEGRDLGGEIDSLYERRLVTKEIKHWAHEVRLAAREAAHPEELGWVERDEAERSLEFADSFLESAVALPARRRARQGEREGAISE